MIALDFRLYDISDVYDLDREREIPNFDHTLDLPPIEGTTDLHPMDCTCLPCQAQAEYEASFIPDEDGSEAYARMLERRAESGTWWGR